MKKRCSPHWILDMPKLPSINARIIISFLKSKGFHEDRVTGSHFIFLHPALKRRVTVPRHPKDLPKGTLFSIFREAGFNRKDLLHFLNE